LSQNRVCCGFGKKRRGFYKHQLSALVRFWCKQTPRRRKHPFHRASPYAVAQDGTPMVTGKLTWAYGMYALQRHPGLNHESRAVAKTFVTRTEITRGLANIARRLGENVLLFYG